MSKDTEMESRVIPLPPANTFPKPNPFPFSQPLPPQLDPTITLDCATSAAYIILMSLDTNNTDDQYLIITLACQYATVSSELTLFSFHNHFM